MLLTDCREGMLDARFRKGQGTLVRNVSKGCRKGTRMWRTWPVVGRGQLDSLLVKPVSRLASWPRKKDRGLGKEVNARLNR